jgi:hypothetical protein
MGGPQTQPFVLSPVDLPLPEEKIIGAVHVHQVLLGWRAHLTGEDFGAAATPTP